MTPSEREDRVSYLAILLAAALACLIWFQPSWMGMSVPNLEVIRGLPRSPIVQPGLTKQPEVKPTIKPKPSPRPAKLAPRPVKKKAVKKKLAPKLSQKRKSVILAPPKPSITETCGPNNWSRYCKVPDAQSRKR